MERLICKSLLWKIGFTNGEDYNKTLELIKNAFVMGDLNGDHDVTAIDVRFALKYVAGIQDFTNHQLKAGDMDCNGTITAVDARLIMQKALEL